MNSLMAKSAFDFLPSTLKEQCFSASKQASQALERVSALKAHGG